MKVAVVHTGGAACRNAFLRVVLGKDKKGGRIKAVIALSLRMMKSGIFFLKSESEVLLDASGGLVSRDKTDTDLAFHGPVRGSFGESQVDGRQRGQKKCLPG